MFQDLHSLALQNTWNIKFEEYFWLLHWYQLFGIYGTQLSLNHQAENTYWSRRRIAAI